LILRQKFMANHKISFHPLFKSLGICLSVFLSVLFLLGFPSTGISESDDQRETLDRSLLSQINTLFQNDQLEKALERLDTFQQRSPPSVFLDEGYFLEAAILRAQGKDQEAAIPLEQLIEEYPHSPLLDDARLMLGSLYSQLGQPDQAVAVLNNTLLLSPDPNAHREALKLLRTVYEKEGNYPKAIQSALAEMDKVQEQDRRDILDHIQGLVLQHMDESALGDLLDLFPSTFPGDLAMIRLIELHTALGDEVLAERDIRSFLKRFPNHPYAQTAVALLQSFISKIKAHDHVVAAILPFSGKMKPFGIESLNGIRLAYEDAQATLGPNAIGLVIKESATTPSTMRHDYVQLLEEFEPISVIGPLLAREVQLIAPLADQAEVPFITPSATLHDVRKFGRFWFSTALTSTLQVSKLVDYSMSNLGHTRFGILFPESAYGRDLSRQFQRVVEERGGEIIAKESYTRGTTEVSPQILRIKTSDLQQYGKFTTLDGEPYNPEAPKVGSNSEEQPPLYVPGFDAVFLPGQPVEVAFIAAQLAFYDIKVPLLGTNGWNSPDLIRWAGNSLEGSLFVDGLFLETPDREIQAFIERYQKRFGSTPSLFAVQAYDAMRVITDTIQHGATSGIEVRDHLFRRHNLTTLNGFSSFGAGGILDRKIYLIKIHRRHFEQLN
jgi:ABC-type branched-subunit amino acid transport system substrate-binding protein